jgi:hypothetical protein
VGIPKETAGACTSGTRPEAGSGCGVPTPPAASYEFASGKPLELIDGSNLIYLLAEHAELKARIDPSELD